MSRSSNYPDIVVKAHGGKFTIHTTFTPPSHAGAGLGFWVTQIIDKSGKHTGKSLGQVQIGGSGVTNFSPSEVEMTRDNFKGIISRNTPQ